MTPKDGSSCNDRDLQCDTGYVLYVESPLAGSTGCFLVTMTSGGERQERPAHVAPGDRVQ